MRRSYDSTSTVSCDDSLKYHCDYLIEEAYRSGNISLSKSTFGFIKNANGESEPVSKYTWHNRHSMTVSVMTYGATILQIKVPNKKMKTEDIILGFDTLEEYIENKDYKFGATLGRVSGLTENPESNQSKYRANSSAFVGLSNANWIPSVDGVALILSYFSPHGDEGCPGNLIAHVKYQVTEDNRFIVTYRAAVDLKTPVSICHRVYFNLAGQAAGPEELLKHIFHMNCDKVVETKESTITPTGRFINVGSTNYDLRVPQLMIMALARIDPTDLSSYFSVNNDDQYTKKHFVGQFIHRQSGRVMEIYSNQKFVTFSPCNNFPGSYRISKLDLSSRISSKSQKSADGAKTESENISKEVISKFLKAAYKDSKMDLNEPKIIGKQSATYRKNAGFYVQCHYFPNAVYHPTFLAEVTLHPSNIYENEIEYKFGLCGTQ